MMPKQILEPFWKTMPLWRVELFFSLIIMFREKNGSTLKSGIVFKNDLPNCHKRVENGSTLVKVALFYYHPLLTKRFHPWSQNNEMAPGVEAFWLHFFSVSVLLCRTWFFTGKKQCWWQSFRKLWMHLLRPPRQVLISFKYVGRFPLVDWYQLLLASYATSNQNWSTGGNLTM